MFISIDARSPLSIWEQIVFHTKENIAKGILSKGEKLPSVRDLATTLVINPNTVSRAYQELERQGIIETIRGKGTFVSEEYSPAPSAETIDKLKIRLHTLLADSTIEGIKEETIFQWINTYFKRGEEM
jgi:GntR family transcriptional regulator